MVKIGAISLDIRHKKIPYNLGKFYEMTHEWLLEQNYVGLNGDSDFVENLYWEDRGAAVKEYWYFWRLKKKVDNEYFEYHIKLDVHLMAIKDVKVVINNKNVKLQDGEINMNIDGWLEFDPKNKLKNDSIIKFFYNGFMKKHLLRDVELHKAGLKKDMMDFQLLIKKFFEFYNYGSHSPNFHPNRGIGY